MRKSRIDVQPDLSENLKQWDKISRYSTWMYHTYEKYVGNRVLDVGSGIGNMLAFFADRCGLVVATDIFEHQIDYIKKRYADKPQIEAFTFDISNDDLSVLLEYKFDTIILINVLEHIENQLNALQRLRDIVEDNGHIIIFVPAFSKLYCFMDENAGHHRRYDRGVLQLLAKQAGLEIVENKYFNFLGIIPYWLKGKFSRNSKKGGTFSSDLNQVNSKLYNLASAVLEPIESTIHISAGISELIVLKKSSSK